MTIVTSIFLVLVVVGLLYRIKEKSNEDNGGKVHTLKEEPTIEPEQGQESEQESKTTNINTMKESNQEKSMRQQVTCIMHKLGFRVEETDNDLRFDYEGIHMLIMFTEDENYLAILVPGIMDADKNNELTLLQIVEKMNNQLKYVKAFVPHGDSLWLSYERQLYTNEIISENLIEAMITGLANAYTSVGYFINVQEESENGND